MEKLTITRYALTRLTPPIAHFRHWSIIAVLLLLGASNLMAEEVTFSMASKWSSLTAISGPITVTFSGGEGGCSAQTGYIKMPKNNSLSISSSTSTITAVEITYTHQDYSTSKTGKTYDGQLTANTGTITGKATTTTSTWSGSTSSLDIAWDSDGWDLRISQIKVTCSGGVTPVISVAKTGVTPATNISSDILYMGTAQTYSVTSTSSAAIAIQGLVNTNELHDGATNIATVSLNDGTLTITPAAPGKASFTLHQDAVSNSYVAVDKTFTVEVTKHDLILTYTPDQYIYNSDENLTTAFSQPALTGKDETGANVDISSLGISYFSDDTSIATVTDAGAISGSSSGTGTAVIKAKFNGNANYNSTITSFTYSRSSGFSKLITDNVTAGTQPSFNQVQEVKDNSNKLLLTVRYGGYKYSGVTGASHKDTWGKVNIYTGPGKHNDINVINYIDNYKNQSQANYDSRSEGAWSKDGDDWNADSNGGYIEWYSTSETKPGGGTYSQYERIKPFSLPVRGAFMKFEPEVSGVLTAYILQNGVLNFKDERTNTIYGVGDDKSPLAGAPRTYYWFDQDGWRITPTHVTVKQPITIGIDEGKPAEGLGLLAKQLSMWVYGNDEDNTSGEGTYHDLAELRTEWKNKTWVTLNLADDNPVAQPIINYRGGYLLIQKAYVKYEVPVVAGKSYYFFSNASKLGFAGVNFRRYSDDEKTAKKIVTNSSQTMTPASDNAVTVFKPTGGNLVNTYNTVTLTRTFKQNTWNTICLPFHVTEAQVEKVFGTGTKLVIFNGIKTENNETKAHLLQHVDQNILAGQPYFILPGKDVSSLTFTNVSTDTNLRVNSYGNDGSDYKFIGTLSPTTIKEGDYYINAKSDDANVGKLTAFKGTTAGSLNTYRAFIQKQPSAQGAKAISGISFSGTVGDIDDNNITTGIMEILINEMNMVVKPLNGVFNLQGQKVSDSTNGLPAGMYIINGKKVAIR